MSANNYLRVSRYRNPDKYIVSDCDADTGHGSMVDSADTLEEAVKKAVDYQLANTVEYGIRFDLD